MSRFGRDTNYVRQPHEYPRDLPSEFTYPAVEVMPANEIHYEFPVSGDLTTVNRWRKRYGSPEYLYRDEGQQQPLPVTGPLAADPG